MSPLAPDVARALDEAEEIVLVTRGRTSGHEHRVHVWFAREDDALWLRTDAKADWYLNVVAHPECVVVVGDREVVARYEPSADVDADLKRIVELWRAKYGAMWVQDWFVETGRVPVRLVLA